MKWDGDAVVAASSRSECEEMSWSVRGDDSVGKRLKILRPRLCGVSSQYGVWSGVGYSQYVDHAFFMIESFFDLGGAKSLRLRLALLVGFWFAV